MLFHKGFTMIEVIFAMSLCSLFLIVILNGIVLIKSGLEKQQEKQELIINQIEENLNDLFYPVEDVEWAISLVLP